MAASNENNPPPGRAGRKSILLWGGLIFFVSTWMFVLGILVGRGTAPVHFDLLKLQKELAALKTAVLEKEIKRYKIDSSSLMDKPELDFHEALKSEKENVRVIAPRPKPNPQGNRPEKNASVDPNRSARPSKPEKDLLSEALSESGRRFTIQTAASKDKRFADRLVAELRQKGLPAYRESAQLPQKGLWHRVRIGGFYDRAEAATYLAGLKKRGLTGIVIKR